ncbi:hypothetical protein BUE93_17590 [Chromobacterium amazonense]|uniref:Uncharacterized protein n=1 Tax=Chromobacterium amazonense TaxID=1382803 RepID=A0A2S9X1H9_9NEIS|nr:hypothetical protein BUE93_17590 [Chromobacterium amazonense]
MIKCFIIIYLIWEVHQYIRDMANRERAVVIINTQYGIIAIGARVLGKAIDRQQGIPIKPYSLANVIDA